MAKQRRMSRTSKHDRKNMPKRVTNSSGDSRRTKAASKSHVDVFDFMEREGTSSGTDTEQGDSDVPGLSSSGSSTSSGSERTQQSQLQSPPYSDLEVHAAESKAGFLWYDNHRRDNSIISDSGVSMLSASPVEDSPILGYKSALHELDEMPATNHSKILSGLITNAVPPTPAAHMNRIRSQDLHFMEEPESFYSSSTHPQPQTPRTATVRNSQPGMQPTWQPSPYQSSRGSMPPPPVAQVQVEKSGYDLLASAIGSQDKEALTPIYRKFETLNNRILLYLQHEIDEMENTLKKLDAAIIQEEAHETASARAETTYTSHSRWYRQELMCRISAKVEQYSKLWITLRNFGMADRDFVDTALLSYCNLTKCLEPASRADIAAYKMWIAENAPLVEQETDLHNVADLMTVSRSQVKNTPFPNPTPIILVVVALVSTIVVFKVVPQLLARLVISMVVGAAGLCTLAPHVFSDRARMRESKQTIAV